MRRCVKRAAHRPVLLVLYVLLVLLRCLGAHFTKATETQGMGTVVRRNAPNGEAPRPLRSLCVFVDPNRLTHAWRTCIIKAVYVPLYVNEL